MKFEGKKFNIEHAINLHAYSHVIAPAEAIYDPRLLEEFGEIIKHCHVYLIGLMPNVLVGKAELNGEELVMHLTVGGQPAKIKMLAPFGSTLIACEDDFHLETVDGEKIQPSNDVILRLLHEQRRLIFEVQYVGQAFGKDGSRNALDRLLKHETLQKISLKGIPEHKRLHLLLLQIQPENTVMIWINPRAKDDSTSDARMDAGFQKLYNTSEKERVTLFEASLIRYFKPKFNTEFKDSFPSTNLSVLKDCYDKDFSSVIAEIAFPDLSLLLCSEVVEPGQFHLIATNLHNEEERRVFFWGE